MLAAYCQRIFLKGFYWLRAILQHDVAINQFLPRFHFGFPNFQVKIFTNNAYNPCSIIVSIIFLYPGA